MIRFVQRYSVLLATVALLGSGALARQPDRDESNRVTLPSEATVDAAVQRACEILLDNQERYVPDRPVGTLPEEELSKWQAGEEKRLEGLRVGDEGCEWPYEGVYRVRPDGRIPPGYRVGGTAIVCLALLEAPGLDDARLQAILRSIDFMISTIDDDPDMAANEQSRYDVRGWGQTYALQFFCRILERRVLEDRLERARIEKTIPHLIACLDTGQLSGGGWNYAGRGVSPFMTGATLLALYHAADLGYDVRLETVENALSALEKARSPQRAYAYSGSLRSEKEPMQGACARSAIAELALVRAGRSSTEDLRKAVAGFFEEENWKQLRVRKSQQGTHVPPFGVAPYYFFFGHAYAAIAVEHLPESERPPFRTRMRELLWRTIEEDGAWNDRVFPRTESYSTAMAILSLVADRLPNVKTWYPEPSDQQPSKPKPAERDSSPKDPELGKSGRL